MSSEGSPFTVDKCHDGKTLNENRDICHSNRVWDKDPWLVFGYRAGANISKIIVYNRVDCCANRIVGASIRICSDSGPH